MQYWFLIAVMDLFAKCFEREGHGSWSEWFSWKQLSLFWCLGRINSIQCHDGRVPVWLDVHLRKRGWLDGREQPQGASHLPVELSPRSYAGDAAIAEHKHTVVDCSLVEVKGHVPLHLRQLQGMLVECAVSRRGHVHPQITIKWTHDKRGHRHQLRWCGLENLFSNTIFCCHKLTVLQQTIFTLLNSLFHKPLDNDRSDWFSDEDTGFLPSNLV